MKYMYKKVGSDSGVEPAPSINKRGRNSRLKNETSALATALTSLCTRYTE